MHHKNIQLKAREDPQPNTSATYPEKIKETPGKNRTEPTLPL